VFAWEPFLGRAGAWLRAATLLAALVPGREDELEILATRLRSSDKWQRADAVEGLARLGTGPAWELVVGALADPKGEVADTAEIVLAALDDERALKRLGGEDGLEAEDPRVRARAAELLGRLVRDAPPKWLARALDDDDAEVRRMAAWSIERLAAAGRAGEELRRATEDELARRARSDRDGLTRARALFAWSALAPAQARSAVEAARRERDPLVRGAAAALSERVLGADAGLAALETLAGDPAFSVRAVAAEALGEIGSRAAVAVLVQRLAVEGEERLLLAHVERLQALSGLKHRRDPRPWDDWLDTLPPDWTAPPPGTRRPHEASAGGTVALAGLPILSKRLTILVDLSGSIWNVRPDGKTRKEIVDGKLREALESFTPDTRFNLIPYTGTPIPWQEELVLATPTHVRAAAAWFEQCHATGSGNLWDAALLALEDPEVDTLVVLFDGEPTGGTHQRLELIVPLFLERNAARRVAVDLILVDAARRLERPWGELAGGTGGRLVSVSL